MYHSQERWKVRILRFSEGSSESITTLDFLGLLFFVDEQPSPWLRELYSGTVREDSLFALGEVHPF